MNPFFLASTWNVFSLYQLFLFLRFSQFFLFHINQQTAPLPPSSTSFVFVSPCLQLFFRCLARSTTRKQTWKSRFILLGWSLTNWRIIIIIISNAWKLETIVRTIFKISTWKVFVKNMFAMNNLTDFRKTEETGVDPRLRLVMKAGKHQSWKQRYCSLW